MTAPNIVNVTSITGNTDVMVLTTESTGIVTNNLESGNVYKINALYIANVANAAATANVAVNRGVTEYRLAHLISIPATTTLDVISKAIYLEEGDSIRLQAGANVSLEAICSYEVLTDA